MDRSEKPTSVVKGLVVKQRWQLTSPEPRRFMRCPSESAETVPCHRELEPLASFLKGNFKFPMVSIIKRSPSPVGFGFRGRGLRVDLIAAGT